MVDTPDNVIGVLALERLRLVGEAFRHTEDGVLTDVKLVNSMVDKLLKTVKRLKGLDTPEPAEPKWCAMLLTNSDATTIGPWDSRAEAIAEVTRIRDKHGYRDTHATIGRVKTACPVAHGGQTFRDVWETIEDNAGDEPFCWVTGPVFAENQHDSHTFWKVAEREFAALLKRHFKSSYWTMSDVGQETVELETGVGF